MKKFLLSIFCLFSFMSLATAEEATLSFADKANRTIFTTSQQVWVQNGITLTNNKSESTNNVADYANPARFYKNSQLILETAKGMSKIVFNCNATTHASTLQESIGDAATASGNDVTVELNGETSYIIEELTAQVRMNSLTVTFAEVEDAAVAIPTFSVEAGAQYNPFSVEIVAEKGATIHYTLDGTDPTTESTVYSEAIAFDEFGTSATIKAIAVIDGECSNIATARYSLEVAAPAFSIKGGVYEKLTGTSALTFTTETEGATILYNNRGGDPITAGSKSYGSLSVLSTAEIKAVAFIEVNGKKIYSNVTSEKYYISPVKPFEKAATFTAGTYLIYSEGFLATTLDETSNYGYLPQTAAAANGKFIETNQFYAFTFTEVEGGYTIQDTFGRYIYQTGTYNSFNVANEMPESGAVWTVAIDEATGKATITNVAMNKYIQYSSQYNSFGSYASAQDNGHMPTLFAAREYPTMTITPSNWETLPAFEKVTITCESGIEYNENDENYPYYNVGWNYTPFEFDNVTIIDENTIELSFETPIEENGDYRVILPAGLFILNPSGLAIESEKVQYTYTVENLNSLELTYANPDNGASVKSIEYLYFEFSQSIINNVNGAVITNENGDEFPLTVTDIDGWGEATASNALCLKTAEPITVGGTYTFILKKEYVCAEANAEVRMTEDIKFTFTLTESLKITNISPIEGTEVEVIDELIIECNQDITCLAEAFLVIDENNTLYTYIFTPSYNDKDGNELPYTQLRLVAETPITLPGTYTLFIEDYNIANTDWENQEMLGAQTFTFEFYGGKITSDINEVKGENGEATTIYDLQGRKVETPAKGIYIINGKKTLVK